MRRRSVSLAVLFIAGAGLVQAPTAAAAEVSVEGADTIDTAIGWSALNDNDGQTVVLARSDSFADALAAGAMAGSIRGRFLVTATYDLDDRVAAELDRVDAERVVIVGGTGAVAPAVADELTSLGYRVERIAGVNRVETAVLVARQATFDDGAPLHESPDHVYLARAFGDGTAGFADSLGGGALATNFGRPLLVSTTESLSPETRTYLESLTDLSDVTIIGGTAAISQGVADELTAMGLTVDRVAGMSRSSTADQIALRYFNPSATRARVALIDGLDPSSWVSGFAAATFPESVVLLTLGEEIPGDTAAALQRINASRDTPIPLYCAPQISTDTCATADSMVSDQGDIASMLIGRWLGPEAGFNQAECANGTTEYTFESDGTWLGRNVNIDECGGIFTVGGTYTLSDDGRSLVLRFTICPVSCSNVPDATVSITFDGQDRFTMSDSSFTGTYHRQ